MAGSPVVGDLLIINPVYKPQAHPQKKEGGLGFRETVLNPIPKTPTLDHEKTPTVAARWHPQPSPAPPCKSREMV